MSMYSRGRNGKNAALGDTREMKGRKSLLGSRKWKHKNPGLILTFLNI